MFQDPKEREYSLIEEVPRKRFKGRHAAFALCVLLSLSGFAYRGTWAPSDALSTATSMFARLPQPRAQRQGSQLPHPLAKPMSSGVRGGARPAGPLMSAVGAQAAVAEAAPPPSSPMTVWGERIGDIRKVQAEERAKAPPEFPRYVMKKDVLPSDASTESELAWFKANAMEIKDDMERNGAVVFRGFELMKTQPGFEAFYQAVGMNPCKDPLFSVAARPTANGDKSSAVYEAVNKESRKNFFIGMHNEFVGTRAPRAAAFVCLKPADKGGEFIIADGRKVFRDLDSDLLERLYNRNIRYSVMELPFFGWVDKLPDPLQSPAMGGIKALASAAINAKVDFNVELLEQRGGYDNTRLLQARAPSQVPVVRHPVTGDPTWFCNVHSHSAKLRKSREAEYGAEKFTDGASQINKSDMFYGDDGDLSDADLKHLDEVTKKNSQYIKMDQGDVVLLDNYKTMHGRNVFDGTRKHAVAWFGGWDGEEEQRSRLSQA